MIIKKYTIESESNNKFEFLKREKRVSFSVIDITHADLSSQTTDAISITKYEATP